MLDPMKTRFVRANSAVAFPRILGMEFESESIPRLHSFAWNLGIRPESDETLTVLPALVTWDDFQYLASVYFRIVHPEMGFLDEPDFMASIADRFVNFAGYSDLDAVALGIAALGSFFSSRPHPGEADFLVEARKSLVQYSLNRSPTTYHTAGWMLRTIYLRLTSRPHAAWITSCIALHSAEACGLHKEIQTIALVYPAAPQSDHKAAKMRRSMFWIAKALNAVLAFEYGRSRVTFDGITTKMPSPEESSTARPFIDLAELLPCDGSQQQETRGSDPPATLRTTLLSIASLKTESYFITMLKADMAFGVYRRLWLMSLTDAKESAEAVINVGRAAMIAAQRLLETATSWWNVVSTPFQFICVLLAMDTPKSLALVPETVDFLRRVSQHYDTHMVREAYNQAVGLVKMAHRRKSKELNMLGDVADQPLFDDGHSAGAESSIDHVNATSFLEWPDDLAYSWDVFLNPELLISPLRGDGNA